MPLYQYKAIDANGRFCRGSLDVGNIVDLERRLEKLGMDLVTCKAKGHSNLFQRNHVSQRDLINFSFYLEQLIRAGVPILESLIDLRAGEENPDFRDIITGIIAAIEGGYSFSQALAHYPRIFDEVFISLIKVGEHSGKMTEILADITETLKWQDELLGKARKIMIYPALVGGLVLIVIVFMMVGVVPNIMQAIIGIGGSIPFQTQALMALSDFFIAYWYLIISFPIMTAFVLRYYYKNNHQVRLKLDRILLTIWLFGAISKKIKISRFTRHFALMFTAGVPVLEAVHLSQSVIGNRFLEAGIEQARQQISEGNSMSESFKNTGIFPPLVIRMLRAGEASGKIDQSLNNVSYFFTRDINDSIEKMEPVIQMAMMLIVGGIILWLALSVLGPIYDTISTINF